MQITDYTEVLLKWIRGVQEHEIVIDTVHLSCRDAPEDSPNHTLRVGVLLRRHEL